MRESHGNGGRSTLNFTQLYDGLGTPMRLYVTHNHGPYPLHFPASPPSTGAPHAPSYTVVWPSGGAYDPTRSAAGMTDVFELTYDGATLFARVLGQAFAPSLIPCPVADRCAAGPKAEVGGVQPRRWSVPLGKFAPPPGSLDWSALTNASAALPGRVQGDGAVTVPAATCSYWPLTSSHVLVRGVLS